MGIIFKTFILNIYMFVICFTKNVLLGGLGDRIVGIISIKLISKLLNKPFYILWNNSFKIYFTKIYISAHLRIYRIQNHKNNFTVLVYFVVKIVFK